MKKYYTITELEKEISEETNIYKIKSLKDKLGWMKAEEKGNFITKQDLVEHKSLIIWLMKNKANFNGYLDLKNAMTSLLEIVETKKIVFKTRKGIKGIVSRLSIEVGLNNTEDNLRRINGISIITNTYGNPILEKFQNFKLNTLV